MKTKVNKFFFLLCLFLFVAVLSLFASAAVSSPCPDCGEPLTFTTSSFWNCSNQRPDHSHFYVTQTIESCTSCSYSSVSYSYSSPDTSTTRYFVQHSHSSFEGVGYDLYATTVTCNHCGATIDEDSEVVACDYYEQTTYSYACSGQNPTHRRVTTVKRYCDVDDQVLSTTQTYGPAEYTTVQSNVTHVHVPNAAYSITSWTESTYCAHCHELIEDDFSYHENYEYTDIVNGPVYYNEDADKYQYTLSGICPYCNERIVYNTVTVEGTSMTALYVGDSDWGERTQSAVTYHVGGTSDVLTCPSGQNLISHARMSGRYVGYDNLILFQDVDTNEYYVFGTNLALSSDPYGRRFLVSYSTGLVDVLSWSAVGSSFEAYACQLYYDGVRLYYNGSIVPLNSSIFVNGHQLYKREFQYLVSGNYLQLMTEERWLNYVDWSKVRFFDYDGDGEFEYCFYDTVVALSVAQADGTTVIFQNDGRDDSLLYWMSTLWLVNNTLPDVNGFCVWTNDVIVYVRMPESSTTSSPVRNAVVYCSALPRADRYILISGTFNPSEHTRDYVPLVSEFTFECLYTNGQRRRILPSAITIENIDGDIRIDFFNSGEYMWFGNLAWRVSASAADSDSYMDGYLAGLVDSNPIMGIVEGVWFALRDAALIVLNGISIGGIKLSSVLVSLLIILLVGFFVKHYLK